MAKVKKELPDQFDTYGVKNEPKEVVSEAVEAPKRTEISESDMVWAKEVAAKYEKKVSKKDNMETTHKRVTFLMKRELNDRLNALAEVEGRGFKTQFFNDAIQKQLAVYEAVKKMD